jgi:DNA-binding NarL/FixJ family response regulator
MLKGIGDFLWLALIPTVDVTNIRNTKPDVVIMDIDMPDGH